MLLLTAVNLSNIHTHTQHVKIRQTKQKTHAAAYLAIWDPQLPNRDSNQVLSVHFVCGELFLATVTMYSARSGIFEELIWDKSTTFHRQRLHECPHLPRLNQLRARLTSPLLHGTHSSGVSSFSSSDSFTVCHPNISHVQSAWPLIMSPFQYLGNNPIFPSRLISHLSRHCLLRPIMSCPFTYQYTSSMREVWTGSLSMLAPLGLMLHSRHKA